MGGARAPWRRNQLAWMMSSAASMLRGARRGGHAWKRPPNSHGPGGPATRTSLRNNQPIQAAGCSPLPAPPARAWRSSFCPWPSPRTGASRGPAAPRRRRGARPRAPRGRTGADGGTPRGGRGASGRLGGRRGWVDGRRVRPQRGRGWMPGGAFRGGVGRGKPTPSGNICRWSAPSSTRKLREAATVARPRERM